MTDNLNSGMKREVSEPRLSPSEALTRFVSGGTEDAEDIRAIAAVRFGARVGDIGLLVPSGMLSELVEDAKIYPLPTTPRWFQGLINLRGSLVPVFDLKKLFEMERLSAETTKLLVLNTGQEAVGILINGFPVTLDDTQSLAQFPTLPPILREYSRAVYVQDQEVWVEFDFDGFFQAASNRALAG